MITIVLIVALVLNGIQATDISNLNTACMNCICQIESGCRDVGCVMDVGSLSCGYYQIKENYWIDCGRPGGDWKKCASDKACADSCVRAYMTRYGKYCTGVDKPTCIDFGRIHNGGPKGCTSTATLPYKTKMENCLSSG